MKVIFLFSFLLTNSLLAETTSTVVLFPGEKIIIKNQSTTVVKCQENPQNNCLDFINSFHQKLENCNEEFTINAKYSCLKKSWKNFKNTAPLSCQNVIRPNCIDYCLSVAFTVQEKERCKTTDCS